MALVIKSWAVNSNPPAGQPHIRIVAREGGLISFVLSLLGIDPTTVVTVTSRHIEFETGSLAGFRREITPLQSVSSTFYGRFKPWKLTVGLAVFTVFLSRSTGSAFGGIIVLLVGLGLSGLYYFLNKSLAFGYREYGSPRVDFKFKRSVIEGQDINEDTLRNLIMLIEHLIQPSGNDAPTFVAAGRPVTDRMAEPSPTSIRQVVATPAKLKCSACHIVITPEDVFCGGCGHKLR